MFNLIPYQNKNKLFIFLNFFLILTFFYFVIDNSFYFFNKILFQDNNKHFYDLKMVHNSLVGLINNIDIYEIKYPFHENPKSAYPPYTFELLKNLGKLDWEVFLKYFIFFQILSFFLLFYYSYKLFPLEKIKYLYPIIYFFCLNFSIGLGGTVTGNIAVILYALLAVGFIQLFNKKTIFFNFVILIISLFKFYFLIFYFFPIFLYGFREIKKIIFFISLFILINYFYYVFQPELYLSWLEYVNIQTSRSNLNPWVGTDITQSLLSLSSIISSFFNIDYHLNSIMLNLFYFFTFSTTLFCVFFIYSPIFIKKKSKKIRLKLLSIAILAMHVVYPRLLPFDFFLIIPVYFFLVSEVIFSKNKNKNFGMKFILFFIFLCVQDSQIGLLSISLLFFIICFLEFKKKDPLSIIKS